MDLTTVKIETNRLLLVPADIKYAECIYKNFTAEITQYMYPKPAVKIDETIAFLSKSIAEMQKGTNYQLIITKKDTGEFIGCAGLHDLLSETPELGIWIKKDAFGNKYGQEAIAGIVNWAMKQKRWKKLQYPVDKRNIPSRRIPESLHGVIVRELKVINMSGFELDEVEYEINIET